MDMYTMARKPERPGGKIDIVGSTVDLQYLLNGHDGRLYPRGVHRFEACHGQGATVSRNMQHRSPYPQLEGPSGSVGVHIPKSRGHPEAWEFISPTPRATHNDGSPSHQLAGLR